MEVSLWEGTSGCFKSADFNGVYKLVKHTFTQFTQIAKYGLRGSKTNQYVGFSIARNSKRTETADEMVRTVQIY